MLGEVCKNILQHDPKSVIILQHYSNSFWISMYFYVLFLCIDLSLCCETLGYLLAVKGYTNMILFDLINKSS